MSGEARGAGVGKDGGKGKVAAPGLAAVAVAGQRGAAGSRATLRARLAGGLAALRPRLFPFAPVLIGIGVSARFPLPADPAPALVAAVAVLAAAAAALRVRGGEGWHLPALAVVCLATGFLAAEVRAWRVDAPRLEWRSYGPVQGRVVMIDRSQADQPRLTLDRVVLAGRAPDATPARVRVSLHGAAAQDALPLPGDTVLMTAHLAPPEGPVEPGGFDFRRMAWFDRLGAVGYTRTPVILWEPPGPGEAAVNRLRARMRAAVQDHIPGDAGAFAAALVTGDRAGISAGALQSLRDSNLAHLLAISGLHMGLLAAFVFGAVRAGLALVPPVALRINTKKVAAVVALAAGGFYLLLSGGNVATERAYVMVSVMLVAVLADRRALSLRSVALAACVILLIQPETLAEPGFQMSFAATVALIVAFGALRRPGERRRLPAWLVPVFGVVFTSLVAGLATAPVAAAHFNRMSDYGLLANVLAVPLMGTLVMPAAVAAAVLAPLGLEGAALWVMAQGTRWILGVAGWVAGLEGAVTLIPAPGGMVLPVMALGVLWVMLWPGRVRWLGLAPALLAVALWTAGARPALLVAPDGALVGLMGPGGRALSSPRGAGFAARQWLENDGDAGDQAGAAARPGFEGPPGARRFALGGWRGVVLKGRGMAEALPAACASADLVILPARIDGPPPGRCRVIDAALLTRTGALAIDPLPDGRLRLRPAEATARRWTGGPAAAPMLWDRPAR